MHVNNRTHCKYTGFGRWICQLTNRRRAFNNILHAKQQERSLFEPAKQEKASIKVPFLIGRLLRNAKRIFGSSNLMDSPLLTEALSSASRVERDKTGCPSAIKKIALKITCSN